MNSERGQPIPEKTVTYWTVCCGLAIATTLVTAAAYADPASAATGSSIGGRVFIDHNIDGENDATDGGLSGLSLVLYDIVNIRCISTHTDHNGDYIFNGVLPSSYRIYEAAGETVPAPQNCNPEHAQDLSGYTSTTDNVSTMLTIGHENITAIVGVDFGNVALPTFGSDNNGTVSPGSVKHYHHTFSAPTNGRVSFTRTVNDPNDWSSLLYHDRDCSGDLNGTEANTLLTESLSASKDRTICLINSVFAPDKAKTDQQSTVTLTANFTYGEGLSQVDNQTLQNKDITTASPFSIKGSDTLAVTKTIRNLTQGTEETTAQHAANPGDTLEYRLTYQNKDSAPITLAELKMKNAVPAFTQLEANSMLCENTPATLTCAPDATHNPDLLWHLSGQLAAGAQGSVSYRIIIE